VGPAELLNSLDIPVVHDLPGVGENLQDHLELYLQYACTQPVSLYPSLLWFNQPAIGAEWLFNGTGMGASNQFEAGGFIRSREEFAWPNIQYHFLPVAINYNGSNAVKEHGFQAHVGSMRSPSRGRVQVKSKDPREHPSILFNYMATEQDWQEFRDGIRLTREIMQQPALDAYRGREISPGHRQCRPTKSWTRLSVNTPKPPSIRPARAKWARRDGGGGWRKGACMVCKACVWSMRRSCR
jgi:choline dehydrogenase